MEMNKVEILETPEAPAVNRDALLDALARSNKKVTALEDLLSAVFDAAEDYPDADKVVNYLLGIKDAYEAIYGPIIR